MNYKSIAKNFSWENPSNFRFSKPHKMQKTLIIKVYIIPIIA
jgi:hypothetical protein